MVLMCLKNFLPILQKTLEYFSVNLESKINRDTSVEAQTLLTHISNINIIIFLVITRKVFDFKNSVTAFLQAKSNNIINWFELTGSKIDLTSNIKGQYRQIPQ